MAELKPGIRALIVGCVNRTINVGKECVLQQLLLPGESFIDDTIHDVNCNNTPYTVWVVTGPSLVMTVDSIGGEKCIPGVAIVLPKHLMPLDDPDAKYEEGKTIYDIPEGFKRWETVELYTGKPSK